MDCGLWEWVPETGEDRSDERVANMLGYSLEEISQDGVIDWNNFINPQDVRYSHKKLEACKNGETENYRCEFRAKHKNGHDIYILDIGHVIQRDENGQATLIRGLSYDITQQKKVEKKLADKSAQLEALFEQSPIGIMHYDSKGECLATNESFRKMVGVNNNPELKLYNIFLDPHIPDKEKALLRLGESVNYKSHINFEEEASNRHVDFDKTGLTYMDMSIIVLKDDDNEITGYMLQSIDITEQTIQRDELEKKSLRDKLTGLYSRNHLEEQLEIIKHKRSFPVGFIVADLDNLHFVNNTEGHHVGDEQLRVIGKILHKAFREGDCVCRSGGDEFVAIVEDTDKTIIEEIVIRIRALVDDYNFDNPKHPISLSIGYAIAKDYPNWDLSLIEADTLMYEDKNKKKSQNGDQNTRRKIEIGPVF
jgi:diguanylate cyclase (GGDEF)-like protein/PAS domain S-box-containing protein